MERTQQRRANRLNGCEIVVVVLFVLFIAFMYEPFRNFVGPTRPDIVRISELTGIKFPSDSKVVGSHLTGATTMMLLAKIEIDKSDMHGFLGSVEKEKAVSNEEARQYIEHETSGLVSWWDTHSTRKYEAFPIKSPDHRIWVLINLDDDDRAMIYIYMMAK